MKISCVPRGTILCVATYNHPHRPSTINLLRRVAPASCVGPFLLVSSAYLVESKSNDNDAENGVPVILRWAAAGKELTSNRIFLRLWLDEMDDSTEGDLHEV